MAVIQVPIVTEAKTALQAAALFQTDAETENPPIKIANIKKDGKLARNFGGSARKSDFIFNKKQVTVQLKNYENPFSVQRFDVHLMEVATASGV